MRRYIRNIFYGTDTQEMEDEILKGTGLTSEGLGDIYPFDLADLVYRRLAGEVESRNVQTRMGMSEEERRASLAEETEDVAREDQIFIYDNLGVSANEEYIPSDEYEVLRQAVMRNNSLYAKTNQLKLLLPQTISIFTTIMAMIISR